MVKNYFTLHFRNLLKHKVYFLINVLGLTVSLACGLLAIAFILDENGFDKFHTKKDNIYRLNKHNLNLQTGETTNTVVTSGQMGPTLKREFPEVLESVRIMPWFDESIFGTDDNNYKIDKLVFADASFFEVFDFDLKVGNKKTALSNPMSVILNESLAARLFPNEVNPVGQTVKGIYNLEFEITGIIEDAPRNSHIQYDVLVSWATTVPDVGPLNFSFMNNWLGQTVNTYLLLDQKARPVSVNAKFGDFMKRHFPERVDSYFLYLQPFNDIYLKSYNLLGSRSLKLGNAQFITIFIITAVFLLLIACINYININTAKATQRYKEVGVRKVMGASRMQLIQQFMGESFIITVIALIAAILLVDLSIPSFNVITGKSLSAEHFWQWEVVAAIIGLLVVISIIAGVYPSVYLARFQPNNILKKSSRNKVSGHKPREVLTIFQFMVVMVLIVGTVFIHKQINFLVDKDLGFNKENLMVLTMANNLATKWEAFKEELESNPNIESIAACQASIGSGTYSTTVIPEGINEKISVQIFRSDHNFIKTFGMQIVEGDAFNEKLNAASTGLIINETFANLIGWEKPIGKQIKFGENDPKYPIIGVVKDFHFNPLSTQEIDPVVMFIYPENIAHLNIRLSEHNRTETIEFIATTWSKYETRFPFDYYFVDNWFEEQYTEHSQLLSIVSIFSIISIIIAGLGLYGLVAYTIEQRKREISIRKVFGASTRQLTRLVNSKFLKLAFVAVLLGSPIAFFLIKNWLEDFPYKVTIVPWSFVMIGITITAFVLLIVSIHALKAANSNPITTLRNDQ